MKITEVVGLRDRDDENHLKKVKVLKACLSANVGLPEELKKYFGYGWDENYPLEIEIRSYHLATDNGLGIEVNLSEIPEGVKIIRFYLDSN